MITSVRGRPVAILLVLATSPFFKAQTPQRFSDRTDAIVVGEVLSGRQTGYMVALSLRVTRTIKGGFATGEMVTVSGPCGAPDSKDLTGRYGMFFLKQDGESQWVLQPVTTGTVFEGAYFPLSKNSVPPSIGDSSATPATVEDRIAVELAAGLAAPAGSYMLLVSENQLFVAPDSAITHNIFQSLRTETNAELRFLALAKLMKTGDLSALAEVADNIDLAPRLMARTFVIRAIVGMGKSGPAAVPYLGKIASSSDMYVQQSSADALMRLHTQETLPFLASLLDSRFPRSRELAMAGLSRFVENLPPETEFNVINGKSVMPQGPAPYRTDLTDRYSLSTRSLSDATETEAAFLQFWKSWWASMMDKLMAGN